MEGFGSTELSPAVFVLDAEYVVSHAGSVGRPLFHVMPGWSTRTTPTSSREPSVSWY
jgi:hypothetical protein